MTEKKKGAPHLKEHQFKKGGPGGPGRPRIPEDQKEALRQIQKMREGSRFKFAAAFNRLEDKNHKALTAFVSRPDVGVIELLVARSLLRVLQTAKVSDLQKLRFLMCGGEPKQVEISGPGGEPLRPLAGATTDELKAAWLQLQAIIKGDTLCKSTEKLPPSLASSVPSCPLESVTES